MSTGNNPTVTIDIEANAKAFRDELKKASSDAAVFSKGMKKLNQAGVKQDKELSKISKDMYKFNRGAAKEAERHEKNMVKLISERTNELRKLAAAGKMESADFKKKRKEVADMAELYAELRVSRASATGEGKRGVGRKIGRGAYNGLVGGALGLGGLAVGAMVSRVGQAGDLATQMRSGSIGLAGDKTVQSRDDVKRLMGIGVDAGYDPMDTLEQAKAMSRATGNATDVVHGQQFARAGMLDMGQATGFMGLQARGGASNNPAGQKKDLEKILTLAFANGLEKGRFGEFLQGLSGLMEGAQGRRVGDVGGAGYAQSLALLDSSGQSGLRGARGASVLSQLEQGFLGGGGAAGKAMSLSAMGFGTPGGDKSYYEARKQMEKGFSDPENMKAMLGNLKTRYGGDKEAAAIAGAEQTGLSLEIMERLLNLTGNDAKTNEEIKKLAAESEPLEKQMVDTLKGELSDQAKIQSARQFELVMQGDQVVDSLNSLQDSTNQMIDKYWPLAIKSLEIIAKTVDVVAQATTDAYDFWASIDMFKSDKGDMSPAELAKETAEETIKTVTRQARTGMMSQDDAMSALGAARDENRAKQLELEGKGQFSQSVYHESAANDLEIARRDIGSKSGHDAYTKTTMADQQAQAIENKTARDALAAKNLAEAQKRRDEALKSMTPLVDALNANTAANNANTTSKNPQTKQTSIVPTVVGVPVRT